MGKEMSDLYGQWSEFYDVIYESQGVNRDIPFIVGLVKKYGGPVLECACGTGRVLIPIAEAGFETHGFDISDGMLAVLEKKLSRLPGKIRKKIRFEKADMRHFDIRGKFKTCLLIFSSLFHLANDAQVVEFLKAANKHLVKGGTLIIDVFDFNPDTLQNRFVLVATATDEKGRRIRKYGKVVFGENQTSHCVEKLVVEHKGKSKMITRKFDLHYLFHDRMWTLLDGKGFKVLNVYGNYDGEPYQAGKLNERMIFVARKV